MTLRGDVGAGRGDSRGGQADLLLLRTRIARYWPDLGFDWVASFPDHGETIDGLLNAADAALYRAKARRGDPVRSSAGPICSFRAGSRRRSGGSRDPGRKTEGHFATRVRSLTPVTRRLKPALSLSICILHLIRERARYDTLRMLARWLPRSPLLPSSPCAPRAAHPSRTSVRC